MATTSIGADRGQTGAGGSALERYPDAAIMRDDKPLYFGNDGDAKIEYDEDGNDVLWISGADWRFSDTVQLQFGDSGDGVIVFDGDSFNVSGLTMELAGGDIELSDTVEMRFGNASDMRMNWDGTNFEIQGSAAGKTVISGTDLELSDTVQFSSVMPRTPRSSGTAPT